MLLKTCLDVQSKSLCRRRTSTRLYAGSGATASTRGDRCATPPDRMRSLAFDREVWLVQASVLWLPATVVRKASLSISDLMETIRGC
eukprot:COSAG04_NODE_897_length_9581_cov_96.260599_13_plen_87_part_00